ncbi:MAG: hypothetical protein JXR34_13205 [Bacteroidales bacterium]|nr:hypothetical protein [Bacteroidales bacterium]
MKQYYILVLVLTFVLFPLKSFPKDVSDGYIDSLLMGKTPQEKFEALGSQLPHYSNKGLTKRLQLSRAMLDVAKQLNAPKYLGRAYYELGYSYEIIGENDKAIESCLTALKYLNEAQDTHFIAVTYNEIGLIYTSGNQDWKQYKAIDYFKKFLELQQLRKDTAEIAGAISNIGFSYINMNKWDSALYFNRIALDLRLKINQERTIPISLGNVGLSLYHHGKIDSALRLYNQAVVYYEKQKNYWGLFEVLTNISNVYYQKGDLVNVEKILVRKQKLADEIESKSLERLMYYAWYDYHKRLENYSLAVEYFEKYHDMTDSIRGEHIEERIATLETVYEVEKRENEIQLLKQEQVNRKQRSRFAIITMILAMVGLALLIVFLIVKRRKDAEIHKQKEIVFEREKDLAKSEIEKSRLKEQELNIQLEYKSKQLTSHALNMMKKNQFLQVLESDISSIGKKAGDEVKGQLRSLNMSVKRMNKSDKDWELFRNYFEEVNVGFYENLNKKLPGLSTNDYRICALIRLNMNIKESAAVLNISPESVKTARHRLRKKLDLAPETDLHEFIQGV